MPRSIDKLNKHQLAREREIDRERQRRRRSKKNEDTMEQLRNLESIDKDP
jgi:hypothetical protein